MANGHAWRLYEEERDPVIERPFQLELYEKLIHLFHAAIILILSLLLRKTNIIWEDGYGLEIRCYGEGGQLILGPSPWKVVLLKHLLSGAERKACAERE